MGLLNLPDDRSYDIHYCDFSCNYYPHVNSKDPSLWMVMSSMRRT